MMPNHIMRLVLEEAAKAGTTTAPDTVIATLASTADPIAVISQNGRPCSLQVACNADFGFLVRLRNAMQLNAADVTRAAGLVRWITVETHAWSNKSDPGRQRLAALLFTSACCDSDGTLWAGLAGKNSVSGELLAALSSLISGAKLGISAQGDYDAAPIWEREAVEQMKLADIAKDWQALARLWLHFRNSVRPSLPLTQCMRCLVHFGFEQLIKALSQVTEMLMAMQLVGALSQVDKLRVGNVSDNSYIQFAVLSQLGPRHGGVQITDEEQQLLISMLLRVAAGIERWKAWMLIFGTRPELQEALGRALAMAHINSVEAYIEAIPLSIIQSAARVEVASCLRSFRSAAQDDRAKQLWKLAYERWKAWSFRDGYKALPLSSVIGSALDYAVVGYVVECMSQVDRDANQAALIAELGLVDRAWYGDMTQYLDAVHHLLSRLQPYLHTEQVLKTEEDWLQPKMLWPFDPAEEKYRALSLSANLG